MPLVMPHFCGSRLARSRRRGAVSPGPSHLPPFGLCWSHPQTRDLCMTEASQHGGYLVSVLIFLGAAVAAVPLFRFLGLGAVIGYLFAGIAIGPSGFRF